MPIVHRQVQGVIKKITGTKIISALKINVMGIITALITNVEITLIITLFKS